MYEFNVFNEYRKMNSVVEEHDWESYLCTNFSCKSSLIRAKSFTNKIEDLAYTFATSSEGVPTEEERKLAKILTLFGNVCIMKFLEEMNDYENSLLNQLEDENII